MAAVRAGGNNPCLAVPAVSPGNAFAHSPQQLFPPPFPQAPPLPSRGLASTSPLPTPREEEGPGAGVCSLSSPLPAPLGLSLRAQGSRTFGSWSSSQSGFPRRLPKAGLRPSPPCLLLCSLPPRASKPLHDSSPLQPPRCRQSTLSKTRLGVCYLLHLNPSNLPG